MMVIITYLISSPYSNRQFEYLATVQGYVQTDVSVGNFVVGVLRFSDWSGIPLGPFKINALSMSLGAVCI